MRRPPLRGQVRLNRFGVMDRAAIPDDQENEAEMIENVIQKAADVSSLDRHLLLDLHEQLPVGDEGAEHRQMPQGQSCPEVTAPGQSEHSS